ncbi:hypothetical protein K2173_020699 [Erythroxylum novogranatense]|uniref:Tetratricopeptide repeat protein 1 n=1 Tax=Erythroxylum novogranatense TaxID=1862640 RepID=A0AAV8TPD0_9ROSI|nr:hypothetical protein K2173_020699 [Erythroxylum novogranatense]
MVVIEPEETTPETLVKQKESTSNMESDAATSNTVAPNIITKDGNDSDGFETASEHEVSDSEEKTREETDRTTEDHNHHKQQCKEEEEKDALKDDDERKQQALEQANNEKLEGNKLFGEGKYEESLLRYEIALQVAPEMTSSVELRSICHANRAVCFMKLGKYEDTIRDCTKALELNPSYMKALLRRGEAHEKLEHFEEAINDMKKILELEPSNDQANKSIRRLEPLAAEKREKMKEEMIGKLKEMGNSILGRFGMSVDNFKAVKDPNTGSYSISFQR